MYMCWSVRIVIFFLWGCLAAAFVVAVGKICTNAISFISRELDEFKD